MNAPLAIGRTTERVVQSVVENGDISGLTPSERVAYYIATCERLGLDPASQPLAVIKVNGREVLYALRGATDQLAAIHRVHRDLVDGPRVVDVGGEKVVLATCRATHPNGRVETEVGAVPLPKGAEAVCNALMKAATKAKRRATLAVLGAGMLDESELGTIDVRALAPAAPIEITLAEPEPTPAVPPDLRVVPDPPANDASGPADEPATRPSHPALDRLADDLTACEHFDAVVAALDDAMVALPGDGNAELRDAAFERAAAHLERIGFPRMRTRLQAAVLALESKRALAVRVRTYFAQHRDVLSVAAHVVELERGDARDLGDDVARIGIARIVELTKGTRRPLCAMEALELVKQARAAID